MRSQKFGNSLERSHFEKSKDIYSRTRHHGSHSYGTEIETVKERERTNEDLERIRLLEEMEKFLKETELLMRGHQIETEPSQLIRSGRDISREQGSLNTLDSDQSDYEESVSLVRRESAGRTIRGSQHYVGDEGFNQTLPDIKSC